MGVGIKFFEEKFEMLKDKIKGRLLNEKKNLNLINPSKNLSSSDNDIIDNNDDEISSDCNKEKYKDELDDTISCETQKIKKIKIIKIIIMIMIKMIIG